MESWISTVWRHNEKGDLYIVYDVTNADTTKDSFPVRVSYMNLNAEKWSQDCCTFIQKFAKIGQVEDINTALARKMMVVSLPVVFSSMLKLVASQLSKN